MKHFHFYPTWWGHTLLVTYHTKRKFSLQVVTSSPTCGKILRHFRIKIYIFAQTTYGVTWPCRKHCKRLDNFLCCEVGVHFMGSVPEFCNELSGQQHADTTTGCVGTTNLQSLVRSGRCSATNACAVRDAFTKYFCSDVGTVSWQDAWVTRTE